ncbi:MAG TPA: hypothetical protein PLQ49_02330 [Methanothrix sp.]|nr:hypothetical protein [Methanothrix sp.]HRW82354.1 hypothetical protein [Methanothrix sp.]
MKGSSSSAGTRRITAAILTLLISWAGAWAEDQIAFEKTAGSAPSYELRLNDIDHLVDGNNTWQNETNETGYWEICGLPPGNYTVCEVEKDGWTQTHPVDGSGSPICHTITITNSSKSDLDFLNRGDRCISGTKYWDKNGNGIKDAPDSPLENWTIFVDLNDSGILDPGEPNDTTDAGGRWQICNLIPGKYNVSEVVKAGWKPTNPPGGYHDAVDITSENATDIDFLNTGIHCLSGHKYWDKNQNGTHDPGEPYLSGWKIIVEDETNPSNRWRVTTNGNGYWEICILPPGRYVFDEEAPDGEIYWFATHKPKGVTVPPNWTDLDFGNCRLIHDEPDQYEQFCESQLVEGTGYVDVGTSVMDKKLAMDYQNQMFGEGDIGMESAQVYSQEPNKLIRPLPNCSDDNNGTTLHKLNFFENTKLEFEGETPLVGRRSISSIERYGGIGADVQETFSVRRLEADQTMFLGQTSNSTIRKTVGVNTLNSFSGTWGTQSSLHKIFYKDIRRRDLFSGEFELQRELKFHENPVCEPKLCPCRGVDC